LDINRRKQDATGWIIGRLLIVLVIYQKVAYAPYYKP
jgi:hypothetical protein